MRKKLYFIISLVILIVFLSNTVFAGISQIKINEEIKKTNEEVEKIVNNEDVNKSEKNNIESIENEENYNRQVQNIEEKEELEDTKEENVEENVKENIEENTEKNEEEEIENEEEKENREEEKDIINNDETEDKILSEQMDKEQIKENEGIEKIQVQEKAEEVDLSETFKLLKTTQNLISDDIYMISTALDSNMVLDIHGASIYDGANVEIYQNKNGNNQKFKVKTVEDGYVIIQSEASGLVLSVQDSGTDNCTNVYQCTYKGLDSQKWAIVEAGNEYYYLVSKNSGLYLDVQGGKSYNSANICIFEGHDGIGQKFKFTKVKYETGEKTIENGIYSISTSLNNKYGLDVTARSKLDETNIELWELSQKNHQRFNVKYLGDGTYSIQAIHSGKYLTVKDAKTQSGTNVEQNTFKDIDSQKWIIKSAGNGNYYIISKCNNLYLNLDGQVLNGTNVNVKTGTNSNLQQFKFNKIDIISGEKTLENGIYSINSKLNTNFALDINYASTENNANLELYQFKNSGNNQKFKVTYLENGYYQIEALCSSKVLTVYDSLMADGTNVNQYTNNNLDSQKWIIKSAGDGYYYIISKCNGLYLNVDGQAANGTNINVRALNNSNAQKYKFINTTENELQGSKTIEDGKYTIESYLNNNYVLDIEATSLMQGANVELYTKNDRNNQKYQIAYLGDGYYKIEALHSKKVLTVTRSLTTDGANVEQREYVGADSQKWVIKSAGGDSYYLISKCNGLALTINGGKAINGANIVTSTLKNNNSQKFKFSNTDYYQYIQENKFYVRCAINDNMVLDVTAKSKEDGVNIELWELKYMAHQKFKFEYLGEGLYTIKAVHSDKVLTVENSSSKDGANVEQREYQGIDSQKWEIIKVGGYYYIRSKCNGRYLNINIENSFLGANINVTSIEKNIDNKKFVIENRQYSGIDVSQFNSNINWKSVGQSGIDFALIRIGYRGYGSGAIVFDKKFKENAVNATSNGVDIGAYFVTQAINYQEGVEEANQVLSKIKECNVKITYPIVVDIEWAGGSEGNNGRADYISVSQRTAAAKGFCETILNAGYTPMIYANKYWLTTYLDMSSLSDYDVWLAHYVTGAPAKTSNYAGKYTIWQYTSKGTVLGISGNVDMNIAYKQYN